MTDIYAVVSHPGPVETSILSELAPTFAARRRTVLDMALRCLEAGIKPEGGLEDPSKGPPVVFLHGRGYAAPAWYPFLPEVAKHRAVIALDLPGFGHSSSPPFTSRDPEEGLGFFVDPVEALLVSLGLTGAVIVGHSLGGFVAAEIALRGGVRPSKLVLIASMGLGPEMTYKSRAFFLMGPERLARRGGPGLLRLINPPPKTPIGDRLAALEHELYAVRGGRPAPAAAFNTLFPRVGPAFNRRPRLSEITCPTWILWGEHDPVFPPSVASAAAAVMPKATLQIEPLGHSPHSEAPERMLAGLLGFLG